MKVLRVLVTTTALLAAGAAMADEAVVHDSYAFDLCTRQISQNPYPIRILPS
ncbi:hypothetical protein J495_3128 [Acinetobacter baumannii 1075025]|uniref:hypothetical protein n=1 Tax=Acinetobacter baumannii TaxID=470 RepID=UPI00044C8DCD|nr:hypothetical protein [Acinetobacter baumannii]EXC97798.1 hypothetical protein J495_3128 [Acinetobacter baumannii 1075025]